MRQLACRAAALFSLLAFAAPNQSLAQPATPDDQAQRHHERGTVFYNLGQFEEAIVEYRRGYEQKAHPVFLFNIAEAYRQLGAQDKALFFYRRYLSTLPDAPNRKYVQERVAELEPLVAPETRSRAAAAPAPLVVPPTTPATRADLTAEAAQGTALPVWKTWWFWTAIGVAAGAVVVGLTLAASRDDGPPRTDLGSQRFF